MPMCCSEKVRVIKLLLQESPDAKQLSKMFGRDDRSARSGTQSAPWNLVGGQGEPSASSKPQGPATPTLH
eukprot:1970975-Amphidinium_carterae.1